MNNSALEPRENFNYVFIGVNKSGKTSIAEGIARWWRAAKPRSTHKIVSFDPTSRIDDITDIQIDPEDDKWAMRLHYLRNCLVFLDETRLLNDKNVPIKGLKGFLQMHTNWNIDVVSIFHNPELVLNCFTYHQPRYFIFNTSAKEGSFQRKIPNYSLCVTAAEQVNDYVATFNIVPQQVWSEWVAGGKRGVPKFPFIVVDTKEQKLFSYNMNKKLTNIKHR